MQWMTTKFHTPSENVPLETKIHDRSGDRNVQILFRQGKLWFVPDGSMYVYYEPTHWRYLG